MERLGDDAMDEPVSNMWSRGAPDSVIPTPISQDLGPLYMVKCLDHNVSRRQWAELTGMSIDVNYNVILR